MSEYDESPKIIIKQCEACGCEVWFHNRTFPLEAKINVLTHALKRIASCEPVIKGDCPSIAREALRDAGIE